MIRISTRGQYALMTMEVLAEQTDDSYVSMKKISHKQNLSVKYLEQILLELKVVQNLILKKFLRRIYQELLFVMFMLIVILMIVV